MSSPASTIKLLPEHLIDQIKAGEVVDSPAGLVKELLENSLDANAKNIEIELIDNGINYLMLKDDGDGISQFDLPLAFARHATSKIENYNDLLSLHSFGFRGEALASIASVSKVQCYSKQKNSPAYLYEIQEGKTTLEPRLTDAFKAAHGTQFIIKDLFYNTPVRLKFLQSQRSEYQQIKKIIYSFVVTHPEVSFSIKINDDDRLEFSKTANLLDRIKEVAGKKIECTESVFDNLKATLYFSPTPASSKHQYLFVNKRNIQNKKIHFALAQSLQKFWDRDQGHYFLFLDLPAHTLDVNVHPKKTEVKFEESSKVFSLISHAVKSYQTPTLDRRETQMPMLGEQEHFRSTLLEKPDDSHHLHDLNWANNSHQGGQQDFPQLLWESPLIILCSFKNELFLVSKKQWFHQQISKLLAFDNPNPIPLLISETLKLPTNFKNLKEKFEKMGLEIDELKPGTGLLRSLPEVLSTLPSKTIVQALLDDKNPNQIFDLIGNEKITLSLTTLFTNQLQALEFKILKKVDQQMLAGLFND